MTETERLVLVRELSELPVDADEQFDPVRVLSTFLPLPGHVRALHDRVLVVRGDRGAGKTTMFWFLRAVAERRLDLARLLGDDRIPRARWVEGFSERAPHPPTHALLELGSDAGDHHLRAFWLGHLAGVLSDAGDVELPPEFRARWLEHRNDPRGWIDAARLSLGPLSARLDALDAGLQAAGERVFVTYDHLDRLFLAEPSRRRKFTSVLVDLWLSLALRYRALRGKIFLREDLYQATRSEWADASKVESRSVRLAWEPPELFRLLARHMGASRGLRAWAEAYAGVGYEPHETFGWLPTGRFVEEEDRRAFMGALAGEAMGTGTRKGYTHRWIVQRTADAHALVLPRTILVVISGAAGLELRKPHPGASRLLHHQVLSGALEIASEQRVREVREEHPEIDRLRQLEGQLLPIPREELVAALGKAPANDSLGVDGERVEERLVELGIIERLDDGRCDIPDLYRFAFGVRRQGGPQLFERRRADRRRPA